jgi:hypothetical protein
LKRDYAKAIEASPDEDITEALFLAMLISQQKEIDLISEKKQAVIKQTSPKPLRSDFP